LEEAVETEVFHSQTFKQTIQNSFLKNNLLILDCLFGLYVFSHQSCATGTLLLPKDIYPRKYRQFFANLFFNAY